MLTFLIAFLFIPFAVLNAQSRIASRADYRKYIDPLLDVRDFGITFSDGGAADASILEPWPAQVIALQGLGEKMVPLLIDCLDDGRVTAARFKKITDSKSMNIPVGYLCLDILTDDIQDPAIKPPECNRDGLGWCIHPGFYFRPDDYDACRQDQCTPRPNVSSVQRNWRWEYLRHRNRMQFSNRFDDWRSGTTDSESSAPPK
jgi:hypothetical protein